MSYTEEQLNQVLYTKDDGSPCTLREYIEFEKLMSSINLKCTAQGIEPIYGYNFVQDNSQHYEALWENKQLEKREKDIT